MNVNAAAFIAEATSRFLANLQISATRSDSLKRAVHSNAHSDRSDSHATVLVALLLVAQAARSVIETLAVFLNVRRVAVDGRV